MSKFFLKFIVGERKTICKTDIQFIDGGKKRKKQNCSIYARKL